MHIFYTCFVGALTECVKDEYLDAMFEHRHLQSVVDNGIQTNIQENTMHNDKRENTTYKKTQTKLKTVRSSREQTKRHSNTFHQIRYQRFW